MWSDASLLLRSEKGNKRLEAVRVRRVLMSAYDKAAGSCGCVAARCEEVLQGSEISVPVTRVSANELRNRVKRDVSEVALAHFLVSEHFDYFPWAIMAEPTKSAISDAVISLGVKDEFVMQTFLKVRESARRLNDIFGGENWRLYLFGKELSALYEKGSQSNG